MTLLTLWLLGLLSAALLHRVHVPVTLVLVVRFVALALGSVAAWHLEETQLRNMEAVVYVLGAATGVCCARQLGDGERRAPLDAAQPWCTLHALGVGALVAAAFSANALAVFPGAMLLLAALIGERSPRYCVYTLFGVVHVLEAAADVYGVASTCAAIVTYAVLVYVDYDGRPFFFASVGLTHTTMYAAVRGGDALGDGNVWARATALLVAAVVQLSVLVWCLGERGGGAKARASHDHETV